jgi:GT2 family glycosyltransferase
MGGVSSYRKEVFEKQQFSNYFEGYGLHEDADFALRVSKWEIYLNTAAQLHHYHDVQGRPKSTIRENGGAKWWYVWRVKIQIPKWRDWFSGMPLRYC